MLAAAPSSAAAVYWRLNSGCGSSEAGRVKAEGKQQQWVGLG
jgi:hypothetical protein